MGEFINTKGQGHFYLCPGCLRFSIFIFSSGSKTVGLNETKLHLEPLLGGGMKVCSWDLGHMIKMAIYGKKLCKTISGTKWPMTLKLDMHPLGTRAQPSLFKW